MSCYTCRVNGAGIFSPFRAAQFCNIRLLFQTGGCGFIVTFAIRLLRRPEDGVFCDRRTDEHNSNGIQLAIVAVLSECTYWAVQPGSTNLALDALLRSAVDCSRG